MDEIINQKNTLKLSLEIHLQINIPYPYQDLKFMVIICQ